MEGLKPRKRTLQSLIASGCVAFLVCLADGQSGIENASGYSSLCSVEMDRLLYDVRIGFFHAGELSADICVEDTNFFFTGLFNTGGPVEKFIRWNGRFTSVGRIENEQPQSLAYLVIEENLRKRNSKIVLAAHGLTSIHGRNRTSREIEHPPGSDLMSALFLSAGCREHMLVHDGEDPYKIDLVEENQDEHINQGGSYFSGQTVQCRYRFTYHTGKVRRVDVWHARVNRRPVPVRIRIRVPIFPDAVFRLRLPETSS